MSKNNDPLFSKPEKAGIAAVGSLLAVGALGLGVVGNEMITEARENPTHTQLDTTRVVTGGIVEALATAAIVLYAVDTAGQISERKRRKRERPGFGQPDIDNPASTNIESVDIK